MGRLVALVGAVAAGIGVAAVVPVLGDDRRGKAIQGWFRLVVRASGVRLQVSAPDDLSTQDTGRALSGPGPVLVAANHVSWVDIPALLAVESMRVVAKTEVRGWPVLGMLAARGGTLFIDRYGLRRLPRTVAEMATALRGGATVLAFPEGTTRCGRVVGQVFRATLQSAIDADVAVRPVRLQYLLDDGTPTTVAAWVGDDLLTSSVWRIVSTRGLVARVEIGARVSTAGRSRREVAADVAAHLRGPATVGAAHAPAALATAHR